MSYFLAPIADCRGQFFDSQGRVLAGGLLYAYLFNSTTPQNTYTDSTGGTANANPITLDSAGRTPSGVYLTSGISYKFILKDSALNTIWTQDVVSGINDTVTPTSQDEWVASGLTPTFVGVTSFTLAADQTSTFHKGRRLKTTNSGGTIYSTITNSVFGALTTVTVENDSGNLDSGLSAVSYGLLASVNTSAPSLKDINLIVSDDADQTKRARFELTNVTAGQKRVLTLQDKDATLPALEDAVWTWNLTLAATVSANALTIAIKTRAGNDPSGGDPVFIAFRNATVATGDYTVLKLVAATSVVVSSGSTLGSRNSIAFRGWVVAFNDASTCRLGIINCLTTVAGAGAGSDVTLLYPLKAWGIASSTAEGGAGAADSAQTFYTGTAVASKAYTVLGWFSYESGLATAGTYSTAPTRLQPWIVGMALPGDVVQVAGNDSGAVATGTTVIPYDNTIPQITEGDQYMTQAMTPSSAANVLEAEHAGFYAESAGTRFTVAMYQDATANALAATITSMVTVNRASWLAVKKTILAATTSATTIKIRAGGDSAGTFTFMGESAAQLMGGVGNGYIKVREIMG